MGAVLICSLAGAPTAVAGSVFHHRCSRCSARLMVAPSGQRILREHPDVRPVCLPCVMASARADGGDGEIEIDLSNLQDILREMRQTVPNFWRKRN